MQNHTTRRYSYGTIEQRFWQYTAVGPFTECWLWHGPTDGDEGYGRLYIGRHKYIYAHRLSYQIHKGPISDNLDILHTCDVNYPVGDVTYRLCVNPCHLYDGTHAENMEDMKNKKRYVMPNLKGEEYSHAKLTTAQVIEIRAMYQSGIPQTHLAQQFGVHSDHIGRIVRRTRWAHVP